MRQFSHPFPFILGVALLICAACSDGGTGGGTSGTGGSGTGGTGDTPVFRGECASNEDVGFFVVQHEIDYSVVNGEVLDGVIPSKILTQVGQEGDCTLWQRKNPFCNPACGPSQTCSQDSMCIPYPLPISVGDVSITGLKKAIAMSFPMYFDTDAIPHPPFDPGAAITLKATGSNFPGFTMYGQGFKPIEIPVETWLIKKGEPLTITWTPDNSAPNATIRVKLNIDQHGNTPVELVCELKDTGSVVVSSTLIDQLLGFGVTGFPNGHVIRHTLDSVKVGPGCVRFEVFSHRLGDLQVADHIPCDATHPCPMGKTCDMPTGTCL